MLGQVGVVVPPGEHSVDRELVVFPDSDKRGLGDERCDLAGDQFAGLHVQVHRVGGEEVMAGVAVELRSLASTGGVLDGERVQPELVRYKLKVLEIWTAQIHPHHRGLVLEVFGYVVQREILVSEDPVAVTASARHLLSIRIRPRSRRATRLPQAEAYESRDTLLLTSRLG